MRQVGQQKFFAIIGPRNVHPTPVGRYDNVKGYRTLWKLPHGEVIGESIGGTHLMESQYFVTESLLEDANVPAR